MKEYRLASSIGRPFDLCLALGRLIVRGILEDFPKLKIVASHGGGGICETISRMDYAYELQDEAFFLGPYKPMKIRKKPSEYMKMLYMDTVCYNVPAVKMVLEWLGPDHVLYGSDAPPLTSLNPVSELKPGATALLTGINERGREQVVLAFQRYGRGKSLVMPVQDTWMWRMHAKMDLKDQTFHTF